MNQFQKMSSPEEEYYALDDQSDYQPSMSPPCKRPRQTTEDVQDTVGADYSLPAMERGMGSQSEDVTGNALIPAAPVESVMDDEGQQGIPSRVGRKQSSFVWSYFTKNKDNKFVSICNLCRVSVRIGKEGGRPGTSSMIKHLKIHHFSISTGHKDAANIPRPQAAPQNPHKASQLTIAESIQLKQKFPANSPVAAAYNRALAIYIALSMKPFSTVDDPAFREYSNVLAPRWNIPGHRYFSDVAVPALQRDITVSLKKDMSGAFGGKVHFTADIWTSRQVKDYIAITGHWVKKSDQSRLLRMKATLAMVSLGGSHTAVNISAILKGVVDDWLKPLNLELGTVTTDNAINFIRSFRDTGTEHIPCLAHCLNLVVRGVLHKADVPVDRMLQVCRNICEHFAHSCAARKHLEEIQQTTKLPAHQLIQDVMTRWNSTLGMLRRLLEQKTAIVDYMMQNSRDNNLFLSPEQWHLMSDLVRLLLPFEECTQLLISRSATLGQVLPVLRVLEGSVEDIMIEIKSQKHGSCQRASLDVACALRDALQENQHLSAIRQDIKFKAASFLDPRFRDDYMENSDFAAVKKYVIQRTQRYYEGQNRDSEGTTGTAHDRTTPSTPPPAKDNAETLESQSFWLRQTKKLRIYRLDEKDSCYRRNTAMLAARAEVEAYMNVKDFPGLSMVTDPLQYWATKTAAWPYLCAVAVWHHSCPPTSAESERMFSSAGNIVTDLRCRLSATNISRLTFIRCNREWISRDSKPPPPTAGVSGATLQTLGEGVEDVPGEEVVLTTLY